VGFGPQFTSTYKQIPQKKFRQGLVVLLGYVIACGHLFDSRKAPKHRWFVVGQGGLIPDLVVGLKCSIPSVHFQNCLHRPWFTYRIPDYRSWACQCVQPS